MTQSIASSTQEHHEGELWHKRCSSSLNPVLQFSTEQALRKMCNKPDSDNAFQCFRGAYSFNSENQSSVRKTTAEFPALPLVRQVRRHLDTADREEADVSPAKNPIPVKSLFLQ